MTEDFDVRDMTVKQLKAYIANLPDELPVYVGTNDVGVDPLREIYITSEFVSLTSVDDDEVIDDVQENIVDADIMSFERQKRPA